LKVTPTAIPDVLIIEPKVFGDARGFFFESFNQKAFNEATGLNVNFVQDNHSRSAKGVLRGLHYQVQQPQGKLVRVVRRAILDVAEDIREGSATFGRWESIELTEGTHRQFWVPSDLARGFVVLSDFANFCTRPLSTTYQSLNGVLRGMIQVLISTGLRVWCRSYRPRTCAGNHLQGPKCFL
jgi:dTDP-4-dehydrorhamnose 3,5-epimerase